MLLEAVDGLSAETVFLDSDEILQDTELPCVCVEIGDEQIEHESLGGSTGSTLKRDTQVNVDILHRARRDALLEAEDIAARIETAIATSTALLNLARSWFPQGIEIHRDSEGSVPSVRMRLQWLVTYSTNERDPTVAIP